MTEQATEVVVADPELRQRVLAGIVELLPRVLKQTAPATAEGTKLFDELGLSSSTTLELLLELEEELEIQIDVEDIDQGDLETIGTLANFIAEHALADG
ncbi:MAG TPA: phosphopantetheine-binding protein [Mycobacteriales bacterium]|nr:phosphopantetheine-binding protein [Mycobacteriales bacterium]